MANPDASLAHISSLFVLAWFATKLVLRNLLGGPMMERTEISLLDVRIGVLSNVEMLLRKKAMPALASGFSVSEQFHHPFSVASSSCM